jgi:hypothetical protein
MADSPTLIRTGTGVPPPAGRWHGCTGWLQMRTGCQSGEADGERLQAVHQADGTPDPPGHRFRRPANQIARAHGPDSVRRGSCRAPAAGEWCQNTSTLHNAHYRRTRSGSCSSCERAVPVRPDLALGRTDPGLLVGVSGSAGLGSLRLMWGTTGPLPNQGRAAPMSRQARRARLVSLLIISCCAKKLL